MERVLMLASVASMIDQFNLPNIVLLQKMGYNVDVACNFIEGNTCSKEQVRKLKRKLQNMGVRCFQVDFARNITLFSQNLKSYWQVQHLMETEHYAFCHCHSPIGGVVARIAGHRTKTKVIYTAHGFHFYKGAPVKNWLLYYPVEKALSWWTDVLITINREDYERALGSFHAKRICYVPGVGIDLSKFHPATVEEKERKREELGLSPEDIVLLSVGELSERKNHAVVLEALKTLVPQNPHLKYLICGQGEEQEHLQRQIEENGLEEHVILLGFRQDVEELYNAADHFVFPSKQEGLPVALMEAMASGLPVICSRIRGNTDLIMEKKCMFRPDDAGQLVRCIEECIAEKDKVQPKNYDKVLDKYKLENVLKQYREIYS